MNGKTIVFMVLLLLMFSSYVIPIKKGESGPDVSPFNYFVPPDNSFGMSSYKEVNWTWIENQVTYSLTKNDVLRNDLLIVNFSYVFTNRKYSYEFTSDGNAYYEFSMVFDSMAESSYIDESCHTVFFNYTDGQLFYNFTDLWIIVGQFDSSFGLIDNVFTMVLGRQCNKNVHVVLDPTFGYSTGGFSTSLFYSPDYYLLASYATMGSSCGTADKLTFKTEDWGETCDVQGAIYEYVDYAADYCGSLVAVTDTVEVDATDDNVEIDLPFSSGPCLNASTNYYLAIRITESVSSTCRVQRYYDPDVSIKVDDTSPLSFDDPLTGEYSYAAAIYIYCTYTEDDCCVTGCTDNCTISDPELNGVTFTNGSVTVEDCGYQNFSLNITDCLGDIDYLNITLDGVYRNVSGGNGTYYVNHTSDLDCNTHYHVYVNASCQNGAYIIEDYYHFTTEACCVLTVQDVDFDGLNTNTSQLCKDYNDTYINISAWINSSCDNTIEYVNISLSTGNYSVWTNENEGEYWTNWTGITFVCNTNYTIWINSSDGDPCDDDIVNNTYYFWTCPCYVEPDCNCTVDDVYPVNGTTGLNWSTNNYFNLTADINVTCGNFTGMYGNISVVGIGYHNVSLSANGTIFYNMSNNYTCGTNYTFWVNITGPQCNNTTWYWFRSETCNVSDVECCDCFNNSCFMYHLNLSIYNYLVEHKYITEDSSMEIEFGSTLVAFLLWFFLVLLTIRSKNVNIVGFSAAIQMLFALYLFNNTSLFAEADILILFFAVFIMAFGAGRIIDFRGKKKKDFNGRRYR